MVANSYLFSGSRTALAIVPYALPILRNASRCMRPDRVVEVINPRRDEVSTSRDERNESNLSSASDIALEDAEGNLDRGV